jgi:hypothetical protein
MLDIDGTKAGTMQGGEDNPDADLPRQLAMAEVSRTLREMTANLLRVIRGAGKPYEIGPQAEAFLQTLTRYREVTGTWPLDDLSEVLSVERDPKIMDRLQGDQLDRALAEERVVRGALQVAASRLIGHTTHESIGLHEIYEGINAIEDVRESRRAVLQEPVGRAKITVATRPRKPKV